MVITKTTQTNTIDTKFEYDETGKMTHKVVTETLEVPETSVCGTTTITYHPDDCDDGDDIDVDIDTDAELEVTVSPFEVITAVAGIASIITSCCLLSKALKNAGQ